MAGKVKKFLKRVGKDIKGTAKQMKKRGAKGVLKDAAKFYSPNMKKFRDKGLLGAVNKRNKKLKSIK